VRMDDVFLYAAIVPPREVLDEVWSVAEATAAETPVGPTQPGKRRASRRRLFGGKPPVEAEPAGPVIAFAPVKDVNLAMAKFGNLALNDANRLSEAVGEAAADWPTPRLRFGGYSTLESETDPSVWVELEGDLDQLQVITRGVHEIAKGLRLFVDRRVFQPRVRLGGVLAHATEPGLEALLARLARSETTAWSQDRMGLFTLVDQGPDLPNFRAFAEIPLGRPAAS
jgi:2'-5' RNA ligase